MDAASAVESPWVVDERHGKGPETGAVPGTGETPKPADARESGDARETPDLCKPGNAPESRKARESRNGHEPRNARESRNARNIIETLANLFYLIQLDAQHPDLVREYTVQAEERLQALIALLPERTLSPDPHHGLRLVPVHGSGSPE